MGKLLIIDDDSSPMFFDAYEPLFNDDEVHHIIYLDSMIPAARESVTEKTCERFLQELNLASSTIYSHEDLVRYLREHGGEFDRIVLDGLEGRCVQIIREVPLESAKTRVVTGSPMVMGSCESEGIPYLDKGNLRNKEQSFLIS